MNIFIVCLELQTQLLSPHRFGFSFPFFPDIYVSDHSDGIGWQNNQSCYFIQIIMALNVKQWTTWLITRESSIRCSSGYPDVSLLRCSSSGGHRGVPKIATKQSPQRVLGLAQCALLIWEVSRRYPSDGYAVWAGSSRWAGAVSVLSASAEGRSVLVFDAQTQQLPLWAQHRPLKHYSRSLFSLTTSVTFHTSCI